MSELRRSSAKNNTTQNDLAVHLQYMEIRLYVEVGTNIKVESYEIELQ